MRNTYYELPVDASKAETEVMYYHGGTSRFAMHESILRIAFLKHASGSYDHLQSSSVILDEDEALLRNRTKSNFGFVEFSQGKNSRLNCASSSYAFGEERDIDTTGLSDSPTDYKYTGQRSYVDDFGLHYYVARWYDPVLAHFCQADTIVPNAGNSGDWNRYAYVLYNPANFNDPTGHFTEDAINEFLEQTYGDGWEEIKAAWYADHEDLNGWWSMITAAEAGDILTWLQPNGHAIHIRFIGNGLHEMTGYEVLDNQLKSTGDFGNDVNYLFDRYILGDGLALYNISEHNTLTEKAIIGNCEFSQIVYTPFTATAESVRDWFAFTTMIFLMSSNPVGWLTELGLVIGNSSGYAQSDFPSEREPGDVFMTISQKTDTNTISQMPIYTQGYSAIFRGGVVLSETVKSSLFYSFGTYNFISVP